MTPGGGGSLHRHRARSGRTPARRADAAPAAQASARSDRPGGDVADGRQRGDVEKGVEDSDPELARQHDEPDDRAEEARPGRARRASRSDCGPAATARRRATAGRRRAHRASRRRARRRRSRSSRARPRTRRAAPPAWSRPRRRAAAARPAIRAGRRTPAAPSPATGQSETGGECGGSASAAPVGNTPRTAAQPEHEAAVGPEEEPRAQGSERRGEREPAPAAADEQVDDSERERDDGDDERQPNRPPARRAVVEEEAVGSSERCSHARVDRADERLGRPAQLLDALDGSLHVGVAGHAGRSAALRGDR